MHVRFLPTSPAAKTSSPRTLGLAISAIASRTVVRRGAVAGPDVGPGRWVRPANYYWRPGGAIAAGAAIGVVTAATAAAWAGAPPAAGYFWYYTDPSRTQGFWDVCQ